MRTFEEVIADINPAVLDNDAARLRAIADELQALDTPRATAVRHDVIALAHLLNCEYAQARSEYIHALSLYEQIDSLPGMARALNGLGNVTSSIGDNAASLEYFGRAIAVYDQLQERVGGAHAIGNLGLTHASMGNYAEALRCFRTAIGTFEELGIPAEAASATVSLGSVMQAIGDYPSALEHLNHAITLHEQAGAPLGVARTYGNIGIVYQELDDLDQALVYHERALALCKELGAVTDEAYALGNLGLVYFSQKDYPRALDHLRQVVQMHERTGDRASLVAALGGLVSVLIGMDDFEQATPLLERLQGDTPDDPSLQATTQSHWAALHRHRGDLDEAHQSLLKALEIAARAGLRRLEADFHKDLRDLARERNDFEGYIEHNNEYMRITTEIRGKETIQKVATMEADRTLEKERKDREKERAVLYSTLPKDIADRVVRGEKVSGDEYEHAAVLFIDVVDFTTHAAEMQPGDVVTLLENIFRSLDDACAEHHVIKIKTIGDSYMCFRGDGSAEENIRSIAAVALDATRSTHTWPNGDPLLFRAGAHAGPVTAGVIGTQRLQYDIWGDTVNVASRMESHGEPGRIHVSEAFAYALQRNDSMTNDSLTLLKRGEVSIKGKGPMTTYWLEGA